MGRHERVFAIAADLARGQTAIGRHVTAGRWTPAIRIEGMHEFVVLDMRGSELAFCHDTFQAAEAFLVAEEHADVREAWSEYPLSYHTDATEAEDERIRRWYEDHRWSNTWMEIEARRERADMEAR